MKRYFFDIREGDDLVVSDEEGVELPTIQAAQEEAAHSLGDMARDAAQSPRGEGSRISIEVRDDHGPVMQLKFSFEITRKTN